MNLQGYVEVLADGDWWKANVIAKKQDQVLVHYVGCDNDDEDEWIQESSHRFRWYSPLANAVKCDIWSLEWVHMSRILLVLGRLMLLEYEAL